MNGDLGLALAAGTLAVVNPCGFAMLPGYLALVVAGQEGAAPLTRVGRALAAAAAMTAGFAVVFGVFGLLSVPLAAVAQKWLPVVTVVVGAGLVVLGVLLLAGRDLALPLPKPRRGAPTARLGSMVGYGLAYAVASLSCAIGPFVAVAGVALRQGDLARGMAAFLAYALGMGLVVAVLAVAAALAASTVAGRVRRALPYVNRVGGALLVLTGLYVAYYGVYELRLIHAGGDPDDPMITAAAEAQAALAGWLDAVGPLPLLGALALLTVGAVAVARRRRSRAGGAG